MEIKQKKKLKCNNCGTILFLCNYCNEEFNDKDVVYCVNDYKDRSHICKECFSNFIKAMILRIPEYIKNNKKVK